MKVAVLLSGGLDSTTALHWATRHHEVVCALAFDYGSNHAAHELACARWQAEHLGIPYHEIDITVLSRYLQSALLSGASAIPTGDYDTDNMKQTVVPFRNGIFLSLAAGIAESRGAEGIVIAAHAGDHAIYPDCREEFMQSMSEAIRLGTYAHLEILRPFIHYSKGDITALGHRLGVDFAHTYSCYCGGDLHCGRCATCRERREAFLAAGVPDPTRYDREANEARGGRESQGAQAAREARDSQCARDTRETRGAQDTRAIREAPNARDARVTQGARAACEARDSQCAQAPRNTRDDR